MVDDSGGDDDGDDDDGDVMVGEASTRTKISSFSTFQVVVGTVVGVVGNVITN